MALPGIQGVIGKVTAGTSITNAFLVILQQVSFDVKSPKPTDISFLFDYREQDTADLQSDITDHFTEENSAIQDEIALRPIRVTLHGYIGELSDKKEGIAQTVQAIASQLTVLAPYVPQLTVSALQFYAQAEQIYNAASAAANQINQAFRLATGAAKQTKQSVAYSFFKEQWQKRALFTVMSPWEIHENMAIESLHAVQEGESQTVSDFRITFKEMRFAQTTSLTSVIAQGRRSQMAALPVYQGTSNPITTPAPNFGGDNSAVLAQ